ncbi:hypothetical protein R3P38DRAFT_1866597 [Favolaschia claudopus]|uniref:Uncharacterized protein n=1 Tax=Favolaschia claudopus TaxID=2862362 RepID=A0AAW0DCW5_9AGAR
MHSLGIVRRNQVRMGPAYHSNYRSHDVCYCTLYCNSVVAMPSLPALTIYLFGISAFLAGLNGLLNGESQLSLLSLPSDCTPALAGASLAAVAMGIYYSLAAYQENRKFFIATVPMRCLTAVVFWRQGWSVPAVWEGGGAVLTALALGTTRTR